MKIITLISCVLALPALAGAAPCDTLAASLKLTNGRVTAADAGIDG